jgi:hypothetical protein
MPFKDMLIERLNAWRRAPQKGNASRKIRENRSVNQKKSGNGSLNGGCWRLLKVPQIAPQGFPGFAAFPGAFGFRGDLS